MEDIQCIFCNTRSDRIVIEENHFKGRKCFQCGLIFISPRPTNSEVINLYSHDQALTSAEMHLSDAFAKRLHAKDNLKIIEKYCERGSLLEIGAGAGYFLNEARKKGFEVCGIEPNRIVANFINNTLKIPCEDVSLNENSFGGKKFDIIYHCNVLSHLYDPIEEVKKIYNSLKSNGILVFETGNIGDIKDKYYSYYLEFGYPDHLFFFGENSINKLLKLARFEIIRIYKYSDLAYLITQQMKEKIKEFISPTAMTTSSANFYNSDVSMKIGSRIPKQAKIVYRTLLYYIRYKIGYKLPKIGRPQQVVVVARKK